MNRLRVLTVGSATIDTIAVIASDHIEQLSMRNADASYLMLEEGRKTDAVEVSSHCGGGAINSAVAMARLGHNVSTLIKIGHDKRAEVVLACLDQEGIAPRFVRYDERTPSGASVMISSHDRNAAIFTYRGANSLIGPDDIGEEAFEVDVVYIASLSDGSADCLQKILHQAKSHGALAAINPGVRQLSARGSKLLEHLSAVDIFLMNQTEAEALIAPLHAFCPNLEFDWTLEGGTELPEPARRMLSGGGYQLALPRFLHAITQLGPRFVVLTMGRHGAMLSTATEVMHCPIIRSAVSGTAGAGDAFGATLTAFLASGHSCETALLAASINAASVIGFIDTQTGLLTKTELQKRLGEMTDRSLVRKWQFAPVDAIPKS